MKTILFDQSSFDVYNDHYIDSTDLIHFLNIYNKKIYLIKQDNEEAVNNEYLTGIINYSKRELRNNPIKIFNDILKKTKIRNLSELLVISSDQEFLYLFDKVPINTCLIYRNMFDCVEVNPTYEFKKLDDVKKLILK